MSAKQLEKRESIVQELLSTEKNYVNRLGLVITHFLRPLSENAESTTSFISKANLRAIFSELTVVHSLNCVLLNSLEKIVDNANPVSSARVGRVFVKIGSFLRWYQSYVSNYDHAFQTLKRLKQKSPAFRQFLASTESKPELGYTDLESLLILPVQRVPQYNMLFSDLAKVTTVAHPDFNDTNAALQLLNQVGSYINEKKREAENIAEVIAIGKTLIGFPNLAVPYRRFVRKTQMFSLPDSAPSVAVVLFAFNDVLLLAQEGEPGMYTVMQYAYWDRVVLCAPESNPIVSENPMAFQIRLKEFIYLLITATPEEKTAWTNLVKENVEQTKRKSAEKEIQIALKKKMLALHNTTSNTQHDSLAIRSLGVLAKGMMPQTGNTVDADGLLGVGGDASSATMIGSTAGGAMGMGSTPLSSMTGGNPSGGIIDTSGISASSTDHPTSYSTFFGAGSSHHAAASVGGGGLGSSGVGFNLDTPVDLEKRAMALEQHTKSKKTRESIETEVKAQLTKDGVKDGSIDDFLANAKVEASYVVPLNIVSKVDLNALLAISTSSFYLFSKSRVIFTGFLWDIKEISSKLHPDFTISMVDGTQWDCRSQFCDDIIYQMRRTYLLTYYGIPETFAWPIVTDEWRQPLIYFEPEKFQFGGFARTFRTACTYLNVSFREDLVWDIVHNPTNQKDRSEADPYSCNELDLSRLEELTNNDLKCIMLALRFNPFFGSLVIRDVVVSREGFAAIADMLKYNQTLRRLVFVNNSLGKDHINTLTDAFNVTPTATHRKLEVLEIRDNNIEALNFLTKYLDVSRKSVVLSTLDLSNSGLGSKAMTSLFTTLRKSTHLYHTLLSLKISGCKMDSESSAAAAAFLATPCALKHLDTSNTQIKLLQVLEAMTRGCIYLETLDISQNKWVKKIEPVLVKFITKTDSMTELRVNGTGLSAEALAHIIEAASTNVYLSQLKIFADENNLGPVGASLISKSFKDMKGIVELSLSDNDFGDEGLNAIFQTFAQSTGNLQRLVLDANFKLKTAKGRAIMLKSLVKMLCSKTCKLVHLSIAGAPAMNPGLSAAYARSASSTRASAQLRLDLLPVLDCLPRARIAELNISGHRMGPRGILALGRSLQECRTLSKVWWDENGTTLESFLALVHAIRSNTTLHVFHPPLVDLSSLLGQGDAWVNAKILKAVEQLAHHISSNAYAPPRASPRIPGASGPVSARKKSDSKPFDNTKSTSTSTSAGSNASSSTSKILKEAAHNVLFAATKVSKKLLTSSKANNPTTEIKHAGELDSSSQTPPVARTGHGKSVKALQVGKVTSAPKTSSSEAKAPKSARGHMEMTGKSKAASATAKALKAEQAAAKAKTARAGGSSKSSSNHSTADSIAATHGAPSSTATTTDETKHAHGEDKRPRASSRHLRLPSNTESKTTPVTSGPGPVPALATNVAAAANKNSRPGSGKLALNPSLKETSPGLSSSAAALITNITAASDTSTSSASNKDTTSEDVPSKSHDDVTAATSSAADDTTTEETSGEVLPSDVHGGDADSDGGSRSEESSEASEVEVLELDEHYDENEDEDYRIEDQPPEALTDDDMEDEDEAEEDEEESEEIKSPRRSHYRADDDESEDGGPRSSGDEDGEPMSPNSARVKTEEEEVDLELDEAIASSLTSSIGTIPSTSSVMTPTEASPNVVARSRKPHLETSLSLALLKDAAQSLPTNLDLSDSEDDSASPEVFEDEDPTDEESGDDTASNEESSHGLPSPKNAHDARGKVDNDLKAAVAHEYGAISDDDDESGDEHGPIEILEDDEDDDDNHGKDDSDRDSVDRSAYDRPPTMPFEESRTPRGAVGGLGDLSTTLTPRLLSPRGMISPRGGASSTTSPGNSPRGPTTVTAGTAGSPSFSSSDYIHASASSSYSGLANSAVSIGPYEHAPVMPTMDVSPRVSPRSGGAGGPPGGVASSSSSSASQTPGLSPRGGSQAVEGTPGGGRTSPSPSSEQPASGGGGGGGSSYTSRRLERKDADIAPAPAPSADSAEAARRRFQSSTSVGEFESIPSLPFDDKLPISPRSARGDNKAAADAPLVSGAASSAAASSTSTTTTSSSSATPASSSSVQPHSQHHNHSPKNQKKKKRRH